MTKHQQFFLCMHPHATVHVVDGCPERDTAKQATQQRVHCPNLSQVSALCGLKMQPGVICSSICLNLVCNGP